MRNPWRFSFDKRPGGTNRLFCGDVGGDRTEEIDIIVSGGNYGWRYKEGDEFPLFSSGAPVNPMPDPLQGPYLGPIASYAHPNQTVGSPALPQLGVSVTGGFVYRGTVIPALQGKYVFGDYGTTSGASDGRLMGLEETSPGSGVFTLTQVIPLTTSNPIVGQRILTLGEDEGGEIYLGLKTNSGVLALGTDGLPAGGIYKIVPLQNVTTILPANKDNTIFSEDVDYARYYSDGLGYLYAGRTGTNFGPFNRRALIAFDIAAQVPAGASIQSAQVKLNLNKMGAAAMGTSLSLHRLTQTWGEGTSLNGIGGFGAPATTNDATWLRSFFNTTSWTTAGGAFIATASASRPAAAGLVIWDSATQATLKTDVQGWLDTPANNAGWILRGDEFTDLSACRFDSKDAGATPPALLLTYTVTPPPTHFESWLATYFPANYVGQYVDPAGDLDGDGIFNLIEYAYGFSPLAANPPNSGLQVSSAAVGANTVVTITFLRDPLATDLTYELQTSGDLGLWTTIATSAGGAGASGSGFVSESGFPISVVTVQETFPTPTKRFVRLRVSRAP